MAEKADNATTVRDLGWRQGSVLPPELFDAVSESINTTVDPAKHVMIVVSQDCDVVHPSYDVEPTVEIIRGSRIDELNGNFTAGKSVRRLQMELGVKQELTRVELFVQERYCIPRRVLEIKGPSSIGLTEAQRRLLAGWMSRRYKRSPFPDRFNQRLTAGDPGKKIRTILRDKGTDVGGIYVQLNTIEELNVEEHYEATFWIIVPTEILDANGNRDRIENEFLYPLEKALRRARGIDVQECMLIAEAEFTLDDVRKTLRWDLDELSYRGDEEDATTTE